MARRNDHTREKIIEMAVKAGRKILNKEGASGFSARKVAREIGYTVGTLYNIFTTYSNLVLHINATTLDAMKEFIADKVSNKKTKKASTHIKALAESYIEFACKNYNSWSALFEFNLSQDAPLPEWYEDKIKALFTLVEAPLQDLFMGKKKKLEQSAKVLWASIHGICQLSITGKLNAVGAASVQALTNSLIDTYVEGLKLQQK